MKSTFINLRAGTIFWPSNRFFPSPLSSIQGEPSYNSCGQIMAVFVARFKVSFVLFYSGIETPSPYAPFLAVSIFLSKVIIFGLIVFYLLKVLLLRLSLHFPPISAIEWKWLKNIFLVCWTFFERKMRSTQNGKKNDYSKNFPTLLKW